MERALMNSIILAGVITVQLALIFYTIFIINEHKKRKPVNIVLYSLTLAVMFDLIATGAMMAGTDKTYFTLHGIIGYSALAIDGDSNVIRELLNRLGEQYYEANLIEFHSM